MKLRGWVEVENGHVEVDIIGGGGDGYSSSDDVIIYRDRNGNSDGAPNIIDGDNGNNDNIIDDNKNSGNSICNNRDRFNYSENVS